MPNTVSTPAASSDRIRLAAPVIRAEGAGGWLGWCDISGLFVVVGWQVGKKRPLGPQAQRGRASVR
jgi:hypothetical protein